MNYVIGYFIKLLPDRGFSGNSYTKSQLGLDSTGVLFSACSREKKPVTFGVKHF